MIAFNEDFQRLVRFRDLFHDHAEYTISQAAQALNMEVGDFAIQILEWSDILAIQGHNDRIKLRSAIEAPDDQDRIALFSVFQPLIKEIAYFGRETIAHCLIQIQEIPIVHRRFLKRVVKYYSRFPDHVRKTLGDPILWVRIARLFHRWIEYDTAEFLYQWALLQDPNNGIVWNSYGWLEYEGRGNNGRAEEYFLRAKALDPLFPFVWINLGNLYYSLHKDNESRDAWQRAVQLNPTVSVGWHNLGLISYERFNNPNQAKKYYYKTLEITPSFGYAYIGLGDIFKNVEKDSNKAEFYYRQATEMDPFNRKTWVVLARFLRSQAGMDDEAKACEKRAEQLEDDFIRQQVLVDQGDQLSDAPPEEDAIE